MSLLEVMDSLRAEEPRKIIASAAYSWHLPDPEADNEGSMQPVDIVLPFKDAGARNATYPEVTSIGPQVDLKT